MSPRRGIVLGVLAAGALGLAGCGDDEDEATKQPAPPRTQVMSVSLDAQGKLQGVKPLKGGVVKVNFANRARLPYDLQLVRVDGNQSIAQVMKVIQGEGGKIPGWLHGSGGVGTTRPGGSGTATQVLEPGSYYAIAEPDTEGNNRPATAKLTVNEGTGTGKLPAADAKVDAFEYGFTASGLKTGRQTIEFANSGVQLHHVVAFRMRPGKTLADVKKFFQTEKGEPPVEEQAGFSTVVLDGRASQVTDVEIAKPGKYALACFITDRAGGPPHAAKGMISETEVKAG